MIAARSSTVVSGLTMHHRSTVSAPHAVGVTKDCSLASCQSLQALYPVGVPSDPAEQHHRQLRLEDQLEMRRGAHQLGTLLATRNVVSIASVYARVPCVAKLNHSGSPRARRDR